MIVAPCCAESWILLSRSSTQRKLGSSWKPTHMRSAPFAVGAATAASAANEESAASANRGMTRRAMRLTKTLT